MIDHLVGRPSAPWRRTQVFLVIFFWVASLLKGRRDGPRVLWLRKANRLLNRFTPWQVLVGAMTSLYAVRNLDTILGLSAPDPLARLYSRSYYRATWIATALDAGFATAMTIRQKWLRDICSVIFSFYYLLYANAADETLRKHRAVCTVEMLRTTWEKTTNPYIRAVTRLRLPRLTIMRRLELPRPAGSKYTKPMIAWLFFDGSAADLARTTELVFDCPGGGFVAMTPEHHEERLRLWTVHSKKPILSLDYGKAPEYPYPWAIEEVFDAYKTVLADKGRALGMSGERLEIILTGDSAGGNLAVCTMLKILESPTFIQRPIALLLSYPALDFNFTSWMTPTNLAVLRSEASSAYIPGLDEQKDHLSHKSPLSMVDDVQSKRMRKKRSWKRSLSEPASKANGTSGSETLPGTASPATSASLPTTPSAIHISKAHSSHCRKSVSFMPGLQKPTESDATDPSGGSESEYHSMKEDERPIMARVMTNDVDFAKPATDGVVAKTPKEEHGLPSNVPLGTRLTMTSRTGYFQDRIISPSMMRAMAILYIGPNQLPDFERDYYVSPILAPEALLEQFPTVLLNCGEKDPFVDDTVIFAGRIRQAKLARQERIRRGSVSSSSSNGLDYQNPMRILAESDEDWVQMRIVEGWSHGYLQMHSLIPQVKTAIEHLATWMEEVFASHARARDGVARHDDGEADDEDEEVTTPKVARRTSSRFVMRKKDGASETETDDQLTFTPKKKRSPPTSFSSSIQEEVLQLDGAGAHVRSGSSSGETLTGPETPDSSELTLPVSTSNTISKGAKRPQATSNTSSQASGAVLQVPSEAPKRRSVELGKPVAPLLPKTGATTTGTRTGTPVFVQGKVPLSEAELMKRRREEAVLGLVSSEKPGGL